MAKRTINLELLAKNNTKKAFKDVGDDASRMGATLGKIGVGIGVAFAAGAAVMIKAGFEAVEALKRLEVIGAQTEAAIKSTGGAANVTAEQVRDLADSLERATATESEAIQEGANLLLTFTNIRNGAGKNERVFDRATELMVDMARAMGTDASGSAVMLGKALNDPVAGIAALTRVGVQFTDEQKDLIKSLAESGDMFGAQQVILNELETQFGGSGEAYASTLAGQIDTLNHNMGGLAESVMISLLPALQDFVAWGNSDLVPFLEDFAEWFVKEGVPAIEDFAAKLEEMAEDGTLVPAVVAGVTGITVAMVALNAAMLANPVGLVIAGLAILAGQAVFVITQWDFLTRSIAQGVATMVGGLLGVAVGVSGSIQSVVNTLLRALQTIMAPVNRILGLLGIAQIALPSSVNFTSGVANLQAMVQGMNVNAMLASSGRPAQAAFGTPSGGFRAMAAGGIVSATPGGVPAVIGEGAYDEAVIPLTARNLSLMGGGGVTVNLSAPNFVGSREELARVVVRAVEDAVKTGAVRRGALA